MPTWRTELPPEGKNRGYDLIRTATSGNTIGIITCQELLVCDTHYWHGRTMPCERQCNAEGRTIDDTHCPACVEKAPWRTHVYVSLFDAKKREHLIFECTTHAAKPLKEYQDAAGTLRGCIMCACRPKATPNGKVAITTHAADLSKCWLPDAPEIPLVLSVIWRLPRTGLAVQPEHEPALATDHRQGTKAPRLRTRAAVLAAMRAQPDNAGDEQTIGEVIAGNGELQKRTHLI